MKIQTRDLKLFLSIAQIMGLNKRVTMPILQSALIDCREGVTSLTITNMDQVCTIYGVKSHQDEVIQSTIPLEALKIAAKTKEKSIELLQTEPHRFTLSGQSCFGVSSDEYPCLDVLTVDHPENVEHICPTLNDLECVSATVSTDESRFNLCGVYYDNKAKSLVATDGHRLHLTNGLTSLQKSALIPMRFIQSVIKILKAEKLDTCDLGFDFSHSPDLAIVKLPFMTLTSRLIDGDFPNYKQVIPKNRPTPQLRFEDPSEVINILQTVWDWHTDPQYSVTLSWKEHELTIFARNPEKGEFKRSLFVQGFIPQDMHVNAKYLLDTLKAFEHNIEISFGDKLEMLLFTSDNKKGVICPMRS